MTETQDFGLGRVQSPPDPKNHLYVARSLAPEDVDAARKYTGSVWIEPGPTLDQGRTPRCVAYSGKQLLDSDPMRLSPDAQPHTYEMYRLFQSLDPWANIPHDGTTIHAGAKGLLQLGMFKGYEWLDPVDSRNPAASDLVKTFLLKNKRPVWIGVNWYDGMFRPDADHRIRISGNVAGGHAVLVIGWNGKTHMYEIINNWGLHWGRGGICYMIEDDFMRLLHEDGEAVGMSMEAVVPSG